MGIPAVQIKDFAGLPAPASPGAVPGTGGLTAFVSTTPPLSVGAPPVTPSLVREITSQARRRELRTAGGDLSVRPLASGTAAPRSVLVAWGSLTQAQQAGLIDWLRDAVWAGQFGFEVRLDGSDTNQSITVRPVGPWEAIAEGLRREIAAIRCEEIR